MNGSISDAGNHLFRSLIAVNYWKTWVILTASATLLGWQAYGAIASVSNLSYPVPRERPGHPQVAGKTQPNLSNSKGTLKEGSAISIDPDEVTGIPKAEANQRFILNKIYRIQEGTTANDLFIVDEKANKWAVEDVSEATMGPTTHSVAQIVSGNGRVWAPIQQF
ncbi:MAG: hypothetical protein U7126_32065 [Microcoleus sp.]